MTIESRRKALMSKEQSHNWGDPIDPKPYRPPGTGRNSEPSSPNGTCASGRCTDTPPTTISNADSTTSICSTFAQELEDQTMHYNGQARESDHTDGDIQIGQLDTTTSSSGSGHSKIMPSTKGWSMDTLVSQSSNFHRVRRISALDSSLRVVMKEFEERGVPLVIESFQDHPKWPQDMFSVDYFTKHAVSDEISVRNVHNWTDTKIQLSEFVDKCRSISPYAEENEQERFYGKDTECPRSWEDWLQTGDVVPSSLIGHGPEDLFRYLPESTSVQTLMCYLGIGDTFTPCHKDLCASSGQNLMCYTENNGASFWFMTASSDAAEAANYFHHLGQELDHENYVITLKELAKAPFKVYIVEQKLGDLVLVPPRSCHQVVNFGGITIKTSWSRMTSRGLVTAYHHELPLYRRVCRPEIYRVKSTVHHALMARTKELEDSLPPSPGGRRLRRISSKVTVHPQTNLLANDLKELLPLFDCILAEEFHPSYANMHHLVSGSSDADDEDPITCDFCGADIFQSFFECRECTEGGTSSGSRLHICPGCYGEGRSCRCQYMEPMQFRNFQVLIDVREKAEKAIRFYEERRNETYMLNFDLKNAGVPALFRAANYLNRIRKNATKEFKVCTIYKLAEGPHDCRFHWVLSCKGCHSGRCFSHLLMDYKVHSVEALLIHHSDKDHKAYHKNHLEGKARFESAKRSLETRQKRGRRSVDYPQLVYNALNFVHCKPISPQFVELGWYDKKYQILEDAEERVPSSLQTSLSTSGEGLADVEDIVHPPPIYHVTSSNDAMQVDVADSAKRKPSVYVLVPRAPYSIRQALNQDISQSTVKNPVTETTPPEPSKPRSRNLSHVLETVSTKPAAPASVSAPAHAPVSQSRHAPTVSAIGSRPGERLIQTNRGFRACIPSLTQESPNNSGPKKTLAALRFKKNSKVDTSERVESLVSISHESRSEVLDGSTPQHLSSAGPIPPSFIDVKSPVPQGQDQPLPTFGPHFRFSPDQSSTLVRPPLMGSSRSHPLDPRGQGQPLDTFGVHSKFPPDQPYTSHQISPTGYNTRPTFPQEQEGFMRSFSTYPHNIQTVLRAIGDFLVEQDDDAQLPPQYPRHAPTNQVQTDQQMLMGYDGHRHADSRHGVSRGYRFTRGRTVKQNSRDRDNWWHGPQAVSPPNHRSRYNPDVVESRRSQGYVRTHKPYYRQDQPRQGYCSPNKQNRRSRDNYYHPYPASQSTGNINQDRLERMSYTDQDRLERLSWNRELTEHDLYTHYQGLERDVTQTPLALHVPGHGNGDATHMGPNNSRPVRGVNLTDTANVYPEEPRRETWGRPANGLTIAATQETFAEPSEDSETRTPTDGLTIIRNDETFPETRNELEMRAPTEDRHDLQRSLITEDRHVLETKVSPKNIHDLETGSQAPDLPNDDQWEDTYDLSDEHDSSPRQIFRPDVITRPRDEDTVSLGDEPNLLLERNPWA